MNISSAGLLRMTMLTCVTVPRLWRRRRCPVEGEYHLGLQTGDVEGRLEGDDRIIFSFEGMDELEPVNGAGTATLQGDRLIFKLMYHYGDEFTFECERRR